MPHKSIPGEFNIITPSSTVYEVRPVCEHEDYYNGPHEGCSEFAPDDVSECSDFATHKITYLDSDWNPTLENTIDLVCDHHRVTLVEWINETPSIQHWLDEIIVSRPQH